MTIPKEIKQSTFRNSISNLYLNLIEHVFETFLHYLLCFMI